VVDGSAAASAFLLGEGGRQGGRQGMKAHRWGCVCIGREERERGCETYKYVALSGRRKFCQ